ncbi:DUF3833 family protein [Hansschlegelia quercus]|nr:DUF3833 family protein [Hansschlegelia quercus]
MVRYAAAFALPLLLAGCAGAPKVFGEDPSAKPFVLEETFLGRGVGEGEFRNAVSGSARPFRVRFNGTRMRDGLTLAEDIAYADGEKERHVWRFTRTGSNTYEGRRDDVVGVAHGVVSGNTLRLSYDVKLKTGGSTAQVHFDDTLVLHAPGVVLNKAKVSKFGVAFGTVDIAISMLAKRGG